MYSDSHRASRIASITLAVVLVALAGLASAGGLLAHQATERVARSTRINEAYERLRYALMLEEARKQKYLSELSREAEAYWAGAAFEVTSAIEQVLVDGDEDDRAVIRRIEALHQQHAEITARAFAAIKQGDVALAQRIDDREADPLFDTIDYFIRAGAARATRGVGTTFDELQRVTWALWLGTPTVFTLGIIVLIRLWLVVRTHDEALRTASHRELGASRRAEEAIRSSEERFRQLFERAADAIFVYDRSGHLLDVNHVGVESLGYSREELAKLTIYDIVDGVTPEQVDAFWEVIAGDDMATAEGLHRRKGGSTFDVELRLTVFESGGQEQVLAVVRDISERKYAERELEATRDFLRAVIDTVGDPIFVKDEEHRWVLGNRAFWQLVGFSEAELLGKSDYDVFPKEQADVFWEQDAHALAADRPCENEELITGADGEVRTILTKKAAFVRADGSKLLTAVIRDVSERKRAEAAIRASQERFRLLFEHAADAIFVFDKRGKVVDLNQVAAESLGYTREEALQLHVRDIAPEVTPEAAAAIREEIRNGGRHGSEGVHRRKDGSTFDVEVRITAFQSRGENLLLTVVRDVSDRKHAEEAIRESEERYRRIVETSHEGIVLTDSESKITFVNERMLEITGYARDEMLGQSAFDLVGGHDRELIHAKIESGPRDHTQHFDAKIKRKDGSDIWIMVSSSSLLGPDGQYQGQLAMVSDITERKRAEDELYQAQKLESVGRLAAGIAHEINTPIQFIGDNVHFLRDSFGSLESVARAAQTLCLAAESTGTLDPTTIDDLREQAAEADLDYLIQEIPLAIEQTLDGVDRVASIVRAMKEFAHPDGNEMSAVDLKQALESTLTVARNEIKYVADVETEFADLPAVTCQIGSINQVFLNLLVNAAHAIADRPEAGRGTIRVRTALDGDQALVTVSDTGCGIPDAIRPKIFEQFFTTKAVGRGTGQGLALARRVVVDQHGGSLTFDSQVGHGTTFSIRLPLHHSSHDRASAALPKAS